MSKETAYKVDEVTTEMTIKVAGVPDTTGPGSCVTTVRPMKVIIRFGGGPDAPIEGVGVIGPTVLRDGASDGCREIWWFCMSWRPDPRPPAWVADIIDHEGLTWPDGWAE